jgi:hypothetical protein
MLVRFSEFIRGIRESGDGDYISGNDWTMDHDWANYKDHYNDSGSMEFDAEESDEEQLINAEDQEDRPGQSRRDLVRALHELGSRVKSLESR